MKISIIFVIVFFLFFLNIMAKPFSFNYSNKYCMSVEKNNHYQCFCVDSCRNYTMDNYKMYNCPVLKINTNCILTSRYGYSNFCLCQGNNYLSCGFDKLHCDAIFFD
uniref:Uncharacterized protein n=1 Tax=Moumouvirus australiensis transpoviron TaxID=2711276 RepID=A0A2P1EHI1_9VIRU|nr:hypothetical protein matv_8 [Moumouvirus australiensis transpoviron]